MMECALRPEAPACGPRGRDAACNKPDRAERPPRAPRALDGDQPWPAFRRRARHGDIASKVDQSARELRPGLEHRCRVARAAAKPLPIPPRSTAAPRSMRRAAIDRVELDRRAGRPVARLRRASARATRTSGHSLARRGPAGSSGRSGRRFRHASERQRSRRIEQPLVHQQPRSGFAVQRRELAARVEPREDALAGAQFSGTRPRVRAGLPCARIGRR